eukprot:CAMPEP_0170551528 /NCGR_PEP_ID=MMETSP0211-20121228/9529_1 /TAXON_ID=311385 /ORGANISM="Pseudokeronopsis sp., Strain OXSARD2" /LENGTH=55 /DNA_ID=CAMNT_0010858763 /DNA_START=601 /DNA_END=768 /DNA_ORIENTATION=+
MNLTMWDVAALQESYKSQLDGEFTKNQLLQKQVYLKAFLDHQINAKQEQEKQEKN